jgi:hypothetical protein
VTIVATPHTKTSAAQRRVGRITKRRPSTRHRHAREHVGDDLL